MTTLAFDPGGTTGVALLDDKGRILRTEAYSPSEVEQYAKRMAQKQRSTQDGFTADFDVVIEKGPRWGQHSPITRSVEEMLVRIFSNAHLIQPNQWKNQPAAQCAEKVSTKHERDAVRLGRWFQARRVRDKNAASKNAKRSRH